MSEPFDSPPPAPTPEPPPVLAGPVAANQDEKTLAIVMHIFGLIGLAIIGPLIIWLMKKDQSPYLDAQGRELLNFQISFCAYAFVSFLLMFLFIGVILLPVVIVAALILTIMGIVRSTEGQVYRFPFIFRLL